MSKKSDRKAARNNTIGIGTQTANNPFASITLNDLKENKAEIIAIIKDTTNDVKEVMTWMMNTVATTSFTSVERFTTDALCTMGYFNSVSAQLSEDNHEAARKLYSIR